MRFTVDSNILVYAVDAETPGKHVIARDLLVRAVAADAILTVQALGEFLSVVRRKFPIHFDAARAQATRWATLFPVAATQWDHLAPAADFSGRHQLQFWDSQIWQTARAHGASWFLSEDLQDGLNLEGMSVLNPFKPGNEARLEALLTDEAEPT